MTRASELAVRLGLPRVEWLEEVGSTLDVAHALANEGAPPGTLILADAQTAGRGRMGRPWISEAGAGLWLTLIERPCDASALDVLSLRIGLALAPVLDAWTEQPVLLKWPNDLYVRARKLGGILIEARWRQGTPDWVAIGVGINVRVPVGEPLAAGLRDGVDRLLVLDAVIPAIRGAAPKTGLLDGAEVAAFAQRDLARGRDCTAPMSGRVAGIDASGSVLIDIGSHTVAVRAGSLVLTEVP
jgi:BirA family biotin operon repressor/biotin-[acetyl-CoA-carboxylase] ligase